MNAIDIIAMMILNGSIYCIGYIIGYNKGRIHYHENRGERITHF